MIKKLKKNKNINVNQTSFYFEDYLETNKKNKIIKKKNNFQDRIYILFSIHNTTRIHYKRRNSRRHYGAC